MDPMMINLQASAVGLVTGILYSWLRAPIPAPNVLGGILAVWGTYIGFLITQYI